MITFSDEEMRQALEDIEKKYPAVHRWFFLWQIEQNREKDAEVCNQTTSGEASRTTG
jgi:hypothetical protein